MVHNKKSKKTNNGPQEKEQKDKQWSAIKRTKRKTMVHKKRSKKTNNGPQNAKPQKTKD
jgi:recombinational DNA repair protein RecT